MGDGMDGGRRTAVLGCSDLGQSPGKETIFPQQERAESGRSKAVPTTTHPIRYLKPTQ